MTPGKGRIARAVALGAVVTSLAVAPSPVHALPGAGGGLCGFTDVTDPTGQPNTQTGEMDGGPLLIGWSPSSGHLTCTIQVGSANSTHAGADAAVVSSPDTPYVVDVPASQATYSATADDNVYICTSVWTADGTWYYDDPNDPTVDGTWSTSSTADCGLAISGGLKGNDPTLRTLDEVVCPVFLFAGDVTGGGVPGVLDIDGYDGDVTILGEPFWDCGPYGFSNGQGNAYGHTKHDPAPGPPGSSDPIPPEPPPPTPVYPKGTVTISGGPLGQVNYAYTGFDPSLAGWSCTEAGTSITCDPPPPGAGQANTCGLLKVEVQNSGTGTVTGTSQCAGVGATATSVGPATTPSTDSQRSDAAFPWTCGATPQSVGSWTVTCTVGP